MTDPRNRVVALAEELGQMTTMDTGNSGGGFGGLFGLLRFFGIRGLVPPLHRNRAVLLELPSRVETWDADSASDPAYVAFIETENAGDALLVAALDQTIRKCDGSAIHQDRMMMPTGQLVNGALFGLGQTDPVDDKRLLRLVPTTGERLKEAREALKVKSKDLAALAGLQPSQVSHFEAGRKGLDTPKLIALLYAAARSGISLNYVICDEGPMTTAKQDQVVVADRSILTDALKEAVRALQAESKPHKAKRRNPTEERHG